MSWISPTSGTLFFLVALSPSVDREALSCSNPPPPPVFLPFSPFDPFVFFFASDPRV